MKSLLTVWGKPNGKLFESGYGLIDYYTYCVREKERFASGGIVAEIAKNRKGQIALVRKEGKET